MSVGCLREAILLVSTCTVLTTLLMLQLKEVAKILSKVVEKDPQGTCSVLGASLLSPKGLPLINVASPEFAQSLLTPDSLKIYSLLAISLFRQQQKLGDPELDSWAALTLDADHRALVKQFLTVMNDRDESLSDMYVVLFYLGELEVAKVRLDLATAAMAQGLRGYKSH